MTPEIMHAVRTGAIAALIWIVIGFIQRTLQQMTPVQALLHELPSTLLVFLLASLYVYWRNSRAKRP